MNITFYHNPRPNTAVLAEWGSTPALAFHRGIPGYAPTPLVPLNHLAAKLGLGSIYVKDESHRFGLNAFKSLGGSWAIATYLCALAGIPLDETAFARLKSPEIAAQLGTRTFITATDGNHGRGVAWAAKMLGHRAVVYMPQGTTPERFNNIRALGADVQILPCNYDDAVRTAAAHAKANGWILTQDTAWPGYQDIPRHIMQGYTTMAAEIEEQLDGTAPTHILLQAGVGSMAGAVAAYFAAKMGENAPKIAVVEPTQADCHFRTAAANDGTLHKVSGAMHSMMAGLCCGEVNPLSWELLANAACCFIACNDDATELAIRQYARPLPGDTPIVSGESGAVTLGVLMQLMSDPTLAAARNQLGLNKTSRVLLISTEGDTDKANYQRILAE